MTKNIKQALNSAFRKVPIAQEDINKFKEYLTALLNITDNKIKELEEHHKNNLRDFFNQIFAIHNFNSYLNTKNRNDLVIHNGDQDSPVGVIIETKKPDDSTEMVTLDKFNVKSLQQLLFYYLQDAVEENNFKLKHLIITDIYNWFIFDATLFQRLFSQNKPLIKDFKDFQEGRLPSKNRPFFYENIASKYIAQWEDELKNNCTYFNLKESENKLQDNQDIESDLSLIPLYKFLSPKHLLKLPFINDSNSLDKDFYNELLYIIGLEEVGDNKKLIQRLPSNNRQEGSLLENVI
ncbi:hypothetical protein [Geminocystis sp. NIES-3709]|uniref:DUF7149 domain-containing protein n=1 Tax=Geminocystis sp. NIES-3709 TaxID=1617448 RepID=UPI0005FC55A6|nr:hypothetical protein [Geminocystis sp. NIES-3709]BAQ64606.1 putative type IIS restriction/modification enzyme [Geminocystis sp. NIES-3709]